MKGCSIALLGKPIGFLNTEYRSFLPALVMGFSTSSSAASMPVTMECGDRYGCDPGVVRFVIPLGTNINRDGSALYEALAVIFICQASDYDARKKILVK